MSETLLLVRCNLYNCDRCSYQSIGLKVLLSQNNAPKLLRWPQCTKLFNALQCTSAGCGNHCPDTADWLEKCHFQPTSLLFLCIQDALWIHKVECIRSVSFCIQNVYPGYAKIYTTIPEVFNSGRNLKYCQAINNFITRGVSNRYDNC